MKVETMPSDAIRDSSGSARPIRRVALWVAQLGSVVILAMAAGAKFFNFTEEGSRPLAEALGVGRGVITLIGLVESLALLMLLVPRTRRYGGMLAAATMVGALFSHATRIGWAGSSAAEMWPLAIVVLVASLFVVWADRRA